MPFLLRIGTLSLLWLLGSPLVATPHPPPSDTLSEAARWYYLDRPVVIDARGAVEFLTTDVATLEAELGQRMRLRERIAFRVIQRRLRRALRAGQSEMLAPKRSNRGFTIGVLAGLLSTYGLIAVLFLELMPKYPKPTGVWQGYLLSIGIALGVGLLLLLLLLASGGLFIF